MKLGVKLQSFDYDSEESLITTEVQGEAENQLDLQLAGIKQLIEHIEYDEEEQDVFDSAMEKILFSVADKIGFNGWYMHVPESEKSKNELDEIEVSPKAKVDVLIRFLEQVRHNNKY